jgi:hypothetical protein
MSSVNNTFTPGIPSNVYLPIDGSSVTYTASLKLGLTGPPSLSACYDKYGALWKWSTFESNSLTGVGGLSALRTEALREKGMLGTTAVTYPSSWATVECNNAFPKKWRNLNTTEIVTPTSSLLDYFYADAYSCSAIGITWTLSSSNWLIPNTTTPLVIPQFISLKTSNKFVFSLKLKDYGTQLYTASEYGDINITLNAKVSGLNCDGDQFELSKSFDVIVAAPPKIKLYTANKYVLTGTNVVFENLLNNSESVTSLTAICDDNKTIILKGKDVANNLILSYDIPGYKTIKVTTEFDTERYSSPPITTTFTDIIKVLTHYDDVSEENYRPTFDKLVLPWPDQPKVGSNDWAVADNINSCFSKFYKNHSRVDHIFPYIQ